ncbi:MAG: endoribonuclease MazF [Acidobacteriaceae bacterium]
MKSRKPYIPDGGDIVWLDFDPQAGHEQAGRRPALVLSPAGYNSRAGLAVTCPITSRVKGYPFEVPVNAGEIQGVVLADQVRSLDWRVRNAVKIAICSEAITRSVREKVQILLGLPA